MRTLIVTLILVAALTFAGASPAVDGGGSPPAPAVSLVAPTTAPSVPGCPSFRREAAPLRPVDVIFAEDDSGSMTRSDPAGYRYAAARLAVRYVSTLARGFCNRVGVIHFGSDVGRARQLPLMPVDTTGAELRRALLPGASLGATLFSPALRRARELLGAPIPGRLRIVFVLSDGKPNAPGVGHARELKRIRAAITGLRDVALHVLIIAPRRMAADQKRLWLNLGAASADVVSTADPGRLQRAVTRAVASDLGVTQSAQQTVSASADGRIRVPPLRGQLVVTGLAPHADTQADARHAERPRGPDPARLARRGSRHRTGLRCSGASASRAGR